jgi:HSP20 family protein
MSKATRMQETAQNREQGTAKEAGQTSLTPSRSDRESLARRGYSLPLGGGPLSFMRRFSEEMDRLFEDFGFWRGFAGGQESKSIWTPRIETFERQGKFVVRAELPGVTKDQVSVEITHDDALTIQGERRNQHEEKKEGYYRSECTYGNFYRIVPLPQGVTADNAVARFQDGVLEIEMTSPRRPEAKGRRIEIQENAQTR